MADTTLVSIISRNQIIPNISLNAPSCCGTFILNIDESTFKEQQHFELPSIKLDILTTDPNSHEYINQDTMSYIIPCEKDTTLPILYLPKTFQVKVTPLYDDNVFINGSYEYKNRTEFFKISIVFDDTDICGRGTGGGGEGGSTEFKTEIVNVLPDLTDTSSLSLNCIYMVPVETPTLNHTYDKFIIVDENGVYKWEVLGSESNISLVYTTEEPVTNAIGSISENTMLDSIEYKDVIDRMLQKEYIPSIKTDINSINYISKQNTLSQLNFNITISDVNSNTLTSLEIFQGTSKILYNKELTGSADVTIPINIMNLSINTDTDFRIILYYTDRYNNAKTVLKDINYTFIDYFYFITYDKDFNVITTETALYNDLNNISHKYSGESIYVGIQYPASLGDLISIKDINGFEYISGFEKTVIAIDGISYNSYIYKECINTLNNFEIILNNSNTSTYIENKGCYWITL